MKYYIYTLSHPETKEVRYVGYSKNPKERYYNHLCVSELKTKKNSWIKSLKFKGLNPIMEIIDETETIEQVHDLEIYWIAQFKAWGFILTNLTLGGEGRENPVTEETKQKISKTLKEKYSKEDHKLKNKKWSEDRKIQRSKERKGKIPVCSMLGKVHKARKKILCFKDGVLFEEFDSILQASKDLNINAGSISNVCRGKSKTAKGLIFKYK